MNYTQEQMDKLYRQERNFAVRVDGVWRAAKGAYIPPADAGKVQAILNGKFVTIQSGHYLDLQGYTDIQVEYEVIRRNLASLPPAPKKKLATTDWAAVTLQPPRRRRTTVGNV